MSDSLSLLLSRVSPDPLRLSVPFSSEMQSIHELLFASSSKSQIEKAVLVWLASYQPCLFGRVAARIGAITTCILLEEEILSNTDLWIRDYIQERRRIWTRDGFSGKTSAFILLVISRALTFAEPSSETLAFARRLASLYLLRDDIECDEIYHDEIFLESERDERTAWKWLAGVNYFASAADGRWWQDHRFPGGMAFSVNSVGHLVKTGMLSRSAEELGPNLGNPHISSLPKALEWAMRTIEGAANTKSGRATFLVAQSEETPGSVDLPSPLRGKEHRFYRGYYHTDQTLPTEYFVADALRSPQYKLPISISPI